jgi:hypothetical protein
MCSPARSPRQNCYAQPSPHRRSIARAATIARNEGRALNAKANAQDASRVGKQWFTREDLKVEVDCRENAAIGAIALDEEWPHGEYPQRGRPPKNGPQLVVAE